MTANRIRELREAKGLSQDELGARIGSNKFKISRVENEDTRLDLDLALKIADALSVNLADVLGIEGGTGFREDAAPYKTGPNDPLYRLADSTKARSLYQSQSDVVDELGIHPGDVLLVDLSAVAVAQVKPMAIVIVQLYSSEELLAATTLLRQFVPPNLLITNSRKTNFPPINMASTDAHIKGVVISRHHQFT